MATLPTPPLSPELQRLSQQLGEPTSSEPLPSVQLEEADTSGSRVGCLAIVLVASLDIGVMAWAMWQSKLPWRLDLHSDGVAGPVIGLTIGGIVVTAVGIVIAGVTAAAISSARPRTGRARGVVLDRSWFAKPMGTTTFHRVALVVRYEADGRSHDARLDAPHVPSIAETKGKPLPPLPESLAWKVGDVVEVFYEPDNFGNAAITRPGRGAWPTYVIGMLMFGLLGCGMIGSAVALLYGVF